MRKIIIERVQGESKFFCDRHPDRECYTEMKTSCWYGSRFDLLNIKVNMCDECMEEFYQYIKEKFGVEPHEDELALIRNCCCKD